MGGSFRECPYPHLINGITYLSCLFVAYIADVFRASKHSTYLPRREKPLDATE